MQATTNPNHVAAGFPQDCSLCHSTVQWNGAKFDHNTQTKFALTGAHASVACSTCHVNNQFASLGTACITCHVKDWQSANDPNHAAAGFPQDCQLCHSVVNWAGAKFDHTTQTKFPLTGKHASATCATCHVGNQFATLNTACIGCHLKDWQSTTNPNHAAAGFPQDCQVCHSSTNDWSGAVFNHNATKFPLSGAHTSVACATCHGSNQFSTLDTSCFSCHAKDWQGAKDPNHVAAGFPQDCALCHSMVNWSGAKFDHNSQTKFALTGKHSSVACATCHVNDQFATLSTACAGCHLKDYQGTKNPNHVVGGLPARLRLVPQHHDLDRCDLQSQHHQLPADRKTFQRRLRICHVNGQYAGLSTACSGLPLEGLSGHDESESRLRRIPAGLHVVPQHHDLDRRDVQPQHHQLPAHR